MEKELKDFWDDIRAKHPLAVWQNKCNVKGCNNVVRDLDWFCATHRLESNATVKPQIEKELDKILSLTDPVM